MKIKKILLVFWSENSLYFILFFIFFPVGLDVVGISAAAALLLCLTPAAPAVVFAIVILVVFQLSSFYIMHEMKYIIFLFPKNEKL